MPLLHLVDAVEHFRYVYLCTPKSAPSHCTLKFVTHSNYFSLSTGLLSVPKLRRHRDTSPSEDKPVQRRMRNPNAVPCDLSPSRNDTQLLTVPSSGGKVPVVAQLRRFEAPARAGDLQEITHFVVIHDQDDNR